jgi:hypothetical protein
VKVRVAPSGGCARTRARTARRAWAAARDVTESVGGVNALDHLSSPMRESGAWVSGGLAQR